LEVSVGIGAWLEAHLVGWHFLLPIVVVLVVAVVLAVKRHAPVIPWLAFAAWGAAFISAYVSAGSHRLFSSNRLVWGAHVGTIGLVSIIPIAFAVLVLLVGRRPGTMTMPRAVAALVAGVIGIPLTNVVARALGQWLIPLLIEQSGATVGGP
jgi:hypothetical protein